MIDRNQLNFKFKYRDKLNPLQLYCMLVGVFEDQNFHLLHTIQQANRADFEAGRIYQNGKTGELHIVHFPGKNRNDDEFLSTPRLSEVLNDVESGVAIFLGKNPQYNQNEIYRHFPVSETRKNLEHYVYVNAAKHNPFNVFDSMLDSMFEYFPGVFNKKETKKILLKKNEVKLADSDVKYRYWQDPLINNWQCGYYVVYHLELFLNRLRGEKIKTLDPFKGTTISDDKKKQSALSHFNELYHLGASKLEVKEDYSSEAGIIYESDEEVKGSLKIQETKKSFWRRHPVLTAALVGGGIALAGIVAVGIVVATGGAGIPALAGFASAALGLVNTLAGTLGVAGTIVAGVGAGVATMGLTAGIGISVTAFVNKKPASRQRTETKPESSTTGFLGNALGQPGNPEVKGTLLAPANASSSDLDGFLDLGAVTAPANSPGLGKNSD